MTFTRGQAFLVADFCSDLAKAMIIGLVVGQASVNSLPFWLRFMYIVIHMVGAVLLLLLGLSYKGRKYNEQ